MNCHWWKCACLALILPAAPLRAADSEITDLKELLKGVAREDLRALQYPKEKGYAEILKRVDAKVNDNAKGKTGTFKLKVRSIEERDSAYIVSGELEPLRSGLGVTQLSWGGRLDETEAAKAAKLKKGDTVTVTGEITEGGVAGGTPKATLRVAFSKGKLR